MRSEKREDRKADHVDLICHRQDFGFYLEMRSQKNSMAWTSLFSPGSLGLLYDEWTVRDKGRSK